MAGARKENPLGKPNMIFPPTIRRMLLFMAASSILLSSGCAFGTRHALLSYQPLRPVSLSNGIKIHVARFEDHRPNPRLVGHVLNAYGMKTAKVISQNDVSEWIQDALIAELRNSGYDVVEEGSEAAQLDGEILLVECDSYWTYNGTMNLSMELKRGSDVLFKKSYYTEASEGLNWAAREKSYAAVLKSTLQQSLIKILVDVDRVLKAHPSPA